MIGIQERIKILNARLNRKTEKYKRTEYCEKGDIVVFYGGKAMDSDDPILSGSGFIVGQQYILSEDCKDTYDETKYVRNYFGESIGARIEVVEDSNGRPNGWISDLFLPLETYEQIKETK